LELENLANIERNPSKKLTIQNTAVLLTQLSQAIADENNATAEIVSNRNGNKVKVPTMIDIGTETAEASGGYVTDALASYQDIYSMRVEDLLAMGKFAVIEPTVGGEVYNDIQSTFVAPKVKKPKAEEE
jgi:hypothetical protein